MRIILLLIIILYLNFLLSCNKDDRIVNNPPCPPINIVSIPPYDSPVWHPNGDIIGFNYTPLKEIQYPYGSHCQGRYIWDFDSSGFWLINSDGTSLRRVLHFKLQNPAWSPDGNWIAFVSSDQIYKMRFDGANFDTTSIIQLTFRGRNYHPAWSKDGEWITYNKSVCKGPNTCGIWLMRSDGNHKKFISAYGNYPTWNPTKSEILFLTRAITPDGQVIGDSLWLFDIKTSTQSFFLFLGNNNFDNRYLKYSPDGINIFFLSQPANKLPNIYLIDNNGDNLQKITVDGVEGDSGTPFSINPDGKHIVYTKYDWNDWSYENGTIWILDIINGNKTQLTFNDAPNE